MIGRLILAITRYLDRDFERAIDFLRETERRQTLLALLGKVSREPHYLYRERVFELADEVRREAEAGR